MAQGRPRPPRPLPALALEPRLIRWTPLFALPLGVGLYASKVRDERSLWSGLTTAAGSCLMTLVAYDAGHGADWTRAWLLTGILTAYFAGTVFYVKTMIRERGEAGYLAASIAFHALATIAMLWVHPALVALFALLTARAAIAPRFALSPKLVGIGEAFATVAMAATALIVTG